MPEPRKCGLSQKSVKAVIWS